MYYNLWRWQHYNTNKNIGNKRKQLTPASTWHCLCHGNCLCRCASKAAPLLLCNFHAKPYTGTAMQVKRMLEGRCAPLQRGGGTPPVVRRTAPSNMRIKLTAKLKSLRLSRFLQLIRCPVRQTRHWHGNQFLNHICLLSVYWTQF